MGMWPSAAHPNPPNALKYCTSPPPKNKKQTNSPLPTLTKFWWKLWNEIGLFAIPKSSPMSIPLWLINKFYWSGWILITLNVLCVIKNVSVHPVKCASVFWGAGAVGFRAGNLFCPLPYRAGGGKSKCWTLWRLCFYTEGTQRPINQQSTVNTKWHALIQYLMHTYQSFFRPTM